MINETRSRNYFAGSMTKMLGDSVAIALMNNRMEGLHVIRSETLYIPGCMQSELRWRKWNATLSYQAGYEKWSNDAFKKYLKGWKPF